MAPLIIAPLLAFAPVSAALAQSSTNWTGREIAATAQEIPVRDLSGRERTGTVYRDGNGFEPTRPNGRRDRVRGYVPQRSLYVDPFGNVTVWVGQPPQFLTGQPTSLPPVYRSTNEPVRDAPTSKPCVVGSGPATAGSALASTPSASGSGC